jgi:DNA-binding transcriptional ArsR family regulator
MPTKLPAASRKIGDLDPGSAESLAEFAAILSHPLRIQILYALTIEPGSASTLSRDLDLPLEHVSYHLNQVLDRQHGLVRLLPKRRTRGHDEQFYRVDSAAIMAKADWPRPLLVALSRAFEGPLA